MHASIEPGLAAPRATRRQWLGLAVIALPCLLYAMDLTVLNLALPRLSTELRPSSTQLLWIVDIYGFLVAGLLVTMGSLGDRIGRRRLLLAGGALFGAASVFAACATSAGMLIAARALLGVAGATLAPSTLSLIRSMFADPRQRTTAIAVWATSFSVGGALGPVIGGVLLAHFWWGSVFLLAVPVMVLLLVLGPVLLPADEPRAAGTRLDLASALSSLIAVLAAIFGLKVWAREGAGAVPAAALLVAVVVGAWFVQRQRRLAEPLLDLSLFRARAFSVSLGVFMLTAAIMFGSYIFIGQYLQLVLGLSPVDAGFVLLPGSCSVIAGSMLAPAITRRVRPIVVLGTGLALAALGFAVISQTTALGVPGMIAGAIVLHLGLGPVFTLGTDLVVGAAPPERAGAAAGVSETSAELGGALGIAVLGSVGTALYRAEMAGTPDAARDTLGGAVDHAAHLSAAAGGELLATARGAFTHAFQLTTATCAVIAALTAIAAVLVLRARRAPTLTCERMLATGDLPCA